MLKPAPVLSLHASLTIALFLLTAALWSLAVPPFEAPDETAHAAYVNFLLEHGRLPRAGLEARGEAHQPPLYYALAAAAAAATGLGPIEIGPAKNPAFRWYGGTEENRFLHPASESPPLSGSARSLHWLRLLSVAMGAATVALIHIMAVAAGAPAGEAAAATALAAFIPQFTFIAGSLNNDNLANLLSAATLAFLVQAARRPGRLALWAAAGALCGLDALAKLTGLVMLPLGLIALALSRRDPAVRTGAAAAVFLAPALALSAPLFLRNLLVMGDPFGAAAQAETLPNLLDPKSLLSSYFVTEFPAVLFRSFWGTFGWMSFRMPGAYYVACLLITLGGVAGLVLARPERSASRLLRLFFAAAVAIQISQILIYNLAFTQAQGRFLFPVIGPIALLLCTGLGELARRAGLRAGGPAWGYILIALLAGANLAVLRFLVVPVYYETAAHLP